MSPNNSNRTAILPKFELEFPNKNHVFFNSHNRVKGRVELQFVAEALDVTAITVGFKGDCTLTQGQAGDEGVPVRKQSKKDGGDSNAERRDTKSEALFKYSATVFNSKKSCDFPEGYLLEYPLDYKLPVDLKTLPSSCESLVLDGGALTGDISVTYEIFVKVEYLHNKSRNDGTYIEFLCPIKFQAVTVSQDSVSLFVDPIKTVSHSYVYQNKHKMLFPDPILGGVISAKNHGGGRTKFKKKYLGGLFPGDAGTLKDIPLKLSLAIPSSFDVDRPIGDLRLRIESTQEKFTDEDLGYNGMSTKLGFFEIESITVTLLQYISTTTTERTPLLYTIVSTSLLEEKKFGGNRPVIDLYKFKYDPETKTRYLNTNLIHFLQQKSTLSQKLKQPVINKIKLDDLFTCQNTIKIDITIGTGQQLRRSTMNKKDTHVFSFTKHDITFKMACDTFRSPLCDVNQIEPSSYSSPTDLATTRNSKSPNSPTSPELSLEGTRLATPNSNPADKSTKERFFRTGPVVYTSPSSFYSRWYDISSQSVKFSEFGFRGGVKNSNNDNWTYGSITAFLTAYSLSHNTAGIAGIGGS
ncbi:unnamed protein product [Ambrosiozyma monospora]|uniref:Unnamed protein product n=1 Tax=Ambrosiozyma monospora TaxID=43982 RepID=A0ACB5TCB5_AMBMO|nr:unnamed protein product [Ambrosiozyma monospora]